MTLTRDQAAAAVAAAAGERDGIQANLLDLDASFGRRLLAGANLTGTTKQRWDGAAARLVSLWEIFTAYSAVVDRAAELLARVRRSSSPELTEITGLLTGTSLELTGALAPLDRRELTDTGRRRLTLTMAVQEMKDAFATVADVVTLAENVWNEVAGKLDTVSGQLARVRQQLDGLGDDELAGALAAAEADLGGLRQLLNADPLALLHQGQLETAQLDRLTGQVAAVVARTSDLARLRASAQERIAAMETAVAAAKAAAQDATAVRDRAAARIAVALVPAPPPEAAILTAGLDGLRELAAAGRWPRLTTELAAVEQQASAATRQYRECARACQGLLDRRDELRGLLGAYQAKAAGLGASENLDLTARHDAARDLLWTAPCDLRGAEDAVMDYQRAILAVQQQERRRGDLQRQEREQGQERQR